jgi:hypothetical protein
MRKIFTIALLLFSIATFAQGNLQFNQVLTYSGTINCGQASPTWTVPAGKVWKIEYRSTVNGNPNYDNSQGILGPYGPLFSLNGIKTSDVHLNSSNVPSNSWGVSSDDKQHLWLKSGDQIQFSLNGFNGECSDYKKYNYAISILEYNIIP